MLNCSEGFGYGGREHYRSHCGHPLPIHMSQIFAIRPWRVLHLHLIWTPFRADDAVQFIST